MLDHYKVITITHHDLNVNELDKFVVKEDLTTVFNKLQSNLQIEELQYLSTCNRVSFIFYYQSELTDDFVKQFLSIINPELIEEDFTQILKFVKRIEESDAVEHIFSVASSLDSLVIGEREIIRQFKDSYTLNKAKGLTGDHIRLLNEYTIQAAKAVYSKTRIGEKPISIVSLAIQKLLRSHVNPADRLLLIGAGETMELVCKFLAKHNYSNIVIFNRSINNAEKLTQLLGAKAMHLSELENYTEGFDGIIACTGATDVIVDKSCYEKLNQGDQDKKLVIDLAVPNNIDRSIASDYNVEIIDIETLRELAQENLKFRQTEVSQAADIINEHVTEFNLIHKQRQIEKSLKNLPKEISAVKKRAIEQVYQKDLARLDKDTQELIQEMMSYMEKKCVGIPMKMAKQLVK